MTYRTAQADRSFLCSGCTSPGRGPLGGGQVVCSTCGRTQALPDRSELPFDLEAVLRSLGDPDRAETLRAQTGRARHVPPTLQGVLGGVSVQPGREEEALAIWQSLRVRSQQGDVSASEDLTRLTCLMTETESTKLDAAICEALNESAYDAVVLPRHKQEHLGRLARAAVANGDQAGAQQYLAWMATTPPDLDMDSEARLSAAALATLGGDPRGTLALLGARAGAISIAESMEVLASVFRADAYESLGDQRAAMQILREIPEPQRLAEVTMRYAALGLCASSGPAYTALTTHEAAKRAASGTRVTGKVLGGTFVALGLMFLLGAADSGMLAFVVIGVVLVCIGGLAVLVTKDVADRTEWLREHGTAVTARIVRAETVRPSGDSRPLVRLYLQVTAPSGPYAATFEKEIPEHEISALVGTEMRFRANPANLKELIPEN